jgi:hypothetical protein
VEREEPEVCETCSRFTLNIHQLKKSYRATDLNMAGAFNAKERTKVELEALLKKVDPAFTLRSVVEPKGSALQMMEFVWEGKT